MTDIVQRDEPLAARLTETGYTPPTDLSFDAWENDGHVLGRMARASAWWVGDWLNFGERRYGEAYAQGIEQTGLDYQTLQNYRWVADSVEISRRRENLTFTHHAEVASLVPAEQDRLLAHAQRETLSTRQLRQLARQASPLPANPSPPVGTYSTIVIDPPWRYDNTATRGAAEDHYATMGIPALAAMVLPAADNAHLYLWVTNGMMREGFELCEAWGFQYKALLTWVKPQIGLGNYFRNATEHVIFGLRGKLPTNGASIPTWFKADRTRHSQKPGSFYDLVETASPGPYLEMFARRTRFGWDSWGNEALEHVEIAA